MWSVIWATGMAMLPLVVAHLGGLPRACPIGRPRICVQDEDYCFSYDRASTIGPERWFAVCDTEECYGGANQSPIIIDPSTVYHFCDPSNYLRFTHHQVTGILENDGYYPKIASGNRHLNRASLLGIPGCPDRYLLDSLHFHIGRKGDSRGSEHIVKYKHYDAEMHLVSVRESFGGSGFVAGQAVVGVFLSTTEGKMSYQLNKLLDMVEQIIEYTGNPCSHTECYNNSNVTVCPHYSSGNGRCGKCMCGFSYVQFSPDQLLPHIRNFYYYYGSLTTPTLSESVLWQVMMEPIRITERQLEFMRRLESRFVDESGINIPISRHGNLRPTQRLSGRKVLANKCSYQTMSNLHVHSVK